MASTTSTSNVQFLRFVVIVILGIANFFLEVQAAPWPVQIKHATHRTRLYARGLQLETYHPKSSFKTYNATRVSNSTTTSTDGSDSFVSGEIDSNWRLNESAISFTSSELGINSSNVEYRKGWSGTYGQFAYMRQFIEGIPVANAVANMAYYSNTSRVVSFGSSFINTDGVTVAPSTPSMNWTDILPNIEETLGGKLYAPIDNTTTTTPPPPNLEYLAKSDGSVALTYVMQIRNETEDLWVEAFACAHSGELLSVTDFSAHATFNAVPIQRQSLSDGREVLVDPEDLESSPNGWVAPAGSELGVTSGNNAILFVDGSSTVNGQSFSTSRLESTSGGTIFNNPYNPEQAQSLQGLDATIDNAFYVMNTMHDISYRYGFQENQANFQIDNFGKGGGGNEGPDPVRVSIHDTSDVNNAVFSTPPDGTPPAARFFFFDLGGTVRDSAFANDVMAHEFTHGITNRMTGGGSARCLQTLEASGMGEGWSDMMAAWVAQTSEAVDDFKIGTFFTSEGIRSNPYSADETVNPLKFSDVGKLKEVHSIGEVWANTLYNVYADLVSERGFSANAFTQTDGLEGNVVFMHDMIDGLALQPCNPSMLQSRDAIMAADSMRFNGANQCTMWRAFARKGMGVDAGEAFEDGFSVPAECAI